jgi:hypothetical protein
VNRPTLVSLMDEAEPAAREHIAWAVALNQDIPEHDRELFRRAYEAGWNACARRCVKLGVVKIG